VKLAAPLDVGRVESLMPLVTEQRYTARDTILYALGVGAGASPGDLKYVYEENLEALPSMAVVLAYPGFWQKRPEFGIDWQRVLHAEQKVYFHKPIPVEGFVRGVTTVDQIVDKGPVKGALLYVKREVRDGATDELLATVIQGSFLRGNGGFSDYIQKSQKPTEVPNREPDTTFAAPTSPQQAMIYRLSGDYNPLHVDPLVATGSGFDRPILHGLCTFGIATRAIVSLACGGQGEALRSVSGRFTSFVFPGDTIVTEIWHTGAGKAVFRCRTAERGTVVIDNGTAEFL